MTERLVNIRKKLHDLKKTDRAMQIFGADSHRYKSKKVTEAELIGFEEKIGTTLPSDFRDFLLQIGVGAGPDYGIYSFPQMLKEYEEWSYCLGGTSKLSNPFELTNSDATNLIDKKQNSSNQFHYKRLKTVNGILPIQTEGCTYYNCIVLNGEQHGKIWSVDTNQFDTLPAGLVAELSFLDWFEVWIDKSISQLESQLKKGSSRNKSTDSQVPRSFWKKLFD